MSPVLNLVLGRTELTKAIGRNGRSRSWPATPREPDHPALEEFRLVVLIVVFRHRHVFAAIRAAKGFVFDVGVVDDERSVALGAFEPK